VFARLKTRNQLYAKTTVLLREASGMAWASAYNAHRLALVRQAKLGASCRVEVPAE